MDPNIEPTPVAPETAPQPESQSKSRRRKPLFIVLGVVVVLIAAAVVLVLTHHSKPTQTAQQLNKPHSQGPKNPANLAGYAVGNYPYVIACRIFTPTLQQDNFAGIAGSALISASYAEDSLPVADIPAHGVESTCSREFGSDTVYAKSTLNFTVSQFATVAAAQKYYSTFTISQSDLDKGNAKFKTNLTTDYGPLGSLANTVYGISEHTSYTLVDNKVLSFTASLGSVSNIDFQAALIKTIPTLTASAQAAAASTLKPTDSTVFGKQIGSSTIQNPCQFFTAAGYKTATGIGDDPTDVNLAYKVASATTFPSDVHDGYATDSCRRYSYPGTNSGVESMNLDIHYYKTSAEASQYVQKNVQTHANDNFYHTSAEPVNGIGSYAAYLKPDESTTGVKLSYLYVQKGSYVLVLQGAANVNGQSTFVSSADYQKFAKLLVAKL